MALTDIAKKLKDTFDGFGVSAHQEELKHYRELYGDAECVQIGEMDYIVINDVYKSKEYADVPESTSPLFFNSINNSYAIIDAETSSTLIDEVYSRVTYMQRVVSVDAALDDNKVRKSLSDMFGKEATPGAVLTLDEDVESNKANIFQCQLIKDTGVSAVPDVYSFVIKNGEIKEIAEHVMRQIRHQGEVSLLRDRDLLDRNNAAIQQAVFDKYDKSDMDIQGITVKSIFEISMVFRSISIDLTDGAKRRGVYNTSYLASEDGAFDELNRNIQVCNACGHELLDVKDPSKITRLHINMDAYDEGSSDAANGKFVHAVGCDDCLVQCDCCHGWHFNYSNLSPATVERAKLMPGRGFIRGLRYPEKNYCTCRYGLDWIYDERTGTDVEHDVIPIENMVFVNYANEQIATYAEYAEALEKKRPKKLSDERLAADTTGALANELKKFMRKFIDDFKRSLASKFDIDEGDIFISTAEKCAGCSVCGGNYYRGTFRGEYDTAYRCEICEELIAEKRSSVTRIDGIVFMNHKVKNRSVISKYIVTKFGNLKKLSSALLEYKPETEDQETEKEDELEEA